jgi:nucleoside phosphorylase
MSGLLLVAATESELCEQDGLVCGVGPVEAAAATARALALDPPRAVLHVGIAGARAMPAGTLVVGSEALYGDLVVGIPAILRVEPDARLLGAVRAVLPDAPALPISTSAAVGSSTGEAGVEAMEGFAVLRACALAGVPAVEVRAISNELGEDDRSRWETGRALSSLADALPLLLDALGGE